MGLSRRSAGQYGVAIRARIRTTRTAQGSAAAAAAIGSRMMRSVTLYSWITASAAALAFVVVVLGAYVRLSNAGLSCPDWPGCYGQLTVSAAQTKTHATAHYPGTPLQP